jgi:hypothetical protein
MSTPHSPNADLVNFLNDVGNVHADRVNPAFRSKYASLPEVLDTIKGVAAKHRLAVVQTLDSEEGKVTVYTAFRHIDGTVFPSGRLSVKAEALTPQQIGSAVTYLRRMSLLTSAGIATELDDDGAAASKPTTFSAPASSTQPGVRPLTK